MYVSMSHSIHLLSIQLDTKRLHHQVQQHQIVRHGKPYEREFFHYVRFLGTVK